MKIILSNLAARYHKRLGWNLEILNKYLLKGEWLTQDFLNHHDEYYILAVGGRIDVDKLLADYPEIEVKPYGSEEFHKNAKQLLESRNW
jgi:hypothetical protein